jgi:YegS/Rv2252/BmrU family lipid kinase
MAKSKIACILNCSANSQKAESSCDAVAQHFTDKGVDAMVHLASDGSAIARLAKQAVQQGATTICAGGGDGTISAVASHLVDTGIALGVIPMGTLNHFAKDMGVPLDIPEAIDCIIAGHKAQVDAGTVNGHTFINNASIGLYPKLVAHREELQASGLAKWLAFVPAVYRALRDYAPQHVTITSDEHGTTREKVPFVFIGNNEYETSGAGIGKRSRLDAGRLWVYRGAAATRLEVALLAVKTLGKGASTPELTIFDTEKFSLHTKRLRTKVALDGEVLDLASPLEFSIRKGGLTVIVPRPDMAR